MHRARGEHALTWPYSCQLAVVCRRSDLVHHALLLQEGDEGEEEVPLQAVLVELDRRAVGGGDEDLGGGRERGGRRDGKGGYR